MSPEAQTILSSSFIFLDRITSATERKIWADGVHDWETFRSAPKIKGIGKKRKLYYDIKIGEFEEAFASRDIQFLSEALPKSEHWRLYHLLKHEALYVDIETAQRYGDITVLGAYDGERYYSFVKGCNLEKDVIKGLFSKCRLIITFNGSSFDLPIIERYFGGVLLPGHVHIDLRHVCARLGLAGGLKSIETVLGIVRTAEIDGMSGAEAALLWHEYLLTGDEEMVELLLEYNEADCRNLVPLAEHATRELWRTMRG